MIFGAGTRFASFQPLYSAILNSKTQGGMQCGNLKDSVQHARCHLDLVGCIEPLINDTTMINLHFSEQDLARRRSCGWCSVLSQQRSAACISTLTLQSDSKPDTGSSSVAPQSSHNYDLIVLDRIPVAISGLLGQSLSDVPHLTSAQLPGAFD